MTTEWINVHDRLPKGHWNVNHPHLSPDVLIANICAVEIGFYNRFTERWYIGIPADNNRIDKITHWMPLPKNPNDELRKLL